jgi:serine/threonine protein kinase
MKFCFRDGFKEEIIATILKNTLQALEYIHNQGLIHRDVKVRIFECAFVIILLRLPIL